MTAIHELPTYEQAIKTTQPPPDYYTVAAVSHQSPFHALYRTVPLTLSPITPSTTTNTDDITDVSFNSYTPQCECSIEDLYMALTLSLEDKIKQIERNTEFLQKKIRTRTPNQYIDNMRESASKDFTRIKNRISNELTTLNNVFDLLMLHNAMFMEVDLAITSTQSQLTYTQTKQETQDLLDQLSSQLHHRGRVVHNLELIQQHISRLSCDDDVSYVLKERAKIYNDAKEVVRRQSRAA